MSKLLHLKSFPFKHSESPKTLAMAMSSFYPLSLKEDLRKEFVGKSLHDVSVPAAVLDLGKMKRNCSRMLEAVETLGFGWRAHIKTHKTTELTRLQVGEIGPVNIIVSTILEAENVVPLLQEYKAAGRAVDLLYSFPITPAAVERLALISKSLGPKCLSLMVDHPDQLLSVSALREQSGYAPSVFLKIDMGANRAGVAPSTPSCTSLLTSLVSLESRGYLSLLGLYSHAGQSYSSSSPSSALDYLRLEFEALLITAISLRTFSPGHALVLSVGATPTTTSVRNLLISRSDSEYKDGDQSASEKEEGEAIRALKATIVTIRENNLSIEIHAGVYPVLDIQQLATHALPTSGPHAKLTWDDLAFTILAEVASLYPGRGANGATEALVGCGTIALGREPCKAYDGWGVLTPWNRNGGEMEEGVGVEGYSGLRVGRVSQEHGVLVCDTEGEELSVGQKVRIWPNHACIAGQGFGWYLVVDGADEIVDVWPRWRGW